jgi:hypothetical protein
VVVGEEDLRLTGESGVVVLNLLPQVTLHSIFVIFEILPGTDVDRGGLDSAKAEISESLENSGCVYHSISCS